MPCSAPRRHHPGWIFLATESGYPPVQQTLWTMCFQDLGGRVAGGESPETAGSSQA